jgi:hypothetical protein
MKLGFVADALRKLIQSYNNNLIMLSTLKELFLKEYKTPVTAWKLRTRDL